MSELLTSPAIIFDSLTRNDSIIVVIDEMDKEQASVVISIRPNGKGMYEMEQVDSNFITSVHGRDNFANQIKHAIDNDKILFVSKEKVKNYLVFVVHN